MTRSRQFVLAVYALLAVVAWQAGVLLYAGLVFAGIVLGVAGVYAVNRLRVGADR